MNPRTAVHTNVLIELIRQGRITSLEDLKRSYRKIVMKTHPDAIGDANQDEAFVKFSAFYEEAKEHLSNRETSDSRDLVPQNASTRLRFYQVSKRIEALDMPYAFHRDENRAEIQLLESEARSLFKEWDPEHLELYVSARMEHERIWKEKPSGPYLKHALALNIRPVVHNVLSFQLTGRTVYKRQVRQNIKAVMGRIEEEGYLKFREYLDLLIKDMENGAAVFE